MASVDPRFYVEERRSAGRPTSEKPTEPAGGQRVNWAERAVPTPHLTDDELNDMVDRRREGYLYRHPEALSGLVQELPSGSMTMVPVPLRNEYGYDTGDFTRVPYDPDSLEAGAPYRFQAVQEGMKREEKAREDYEKFLQTEEGQLWLHNQQARDMAAELNDGPINMVWPEMWAFDASVAKDLVGLGARGAARGLKWASRGSWFGPRAAEEMISVGGKMVPKSKAGYVEFGSMSVPGSRVVKHMWGAPDAGSRTARITAAQQHRVAGRAAVREANKSLDELRNGLAEAETAAGQKVPTALDEFQTFARAEAQTQEFARQTGVDLGTAPPAGASPEAAQWSKTLSQSAAQAKGKMDAAVQELKTQQANIDKAAAALDEAAPGLAKKAKEALAQVDEATAELKTMKETPWWKFTRWNQNSHVWRPWKRGALASPRFGGAKKAADPLLAPPATTSRWNYLNFFTGRGGSSRAVSGLMRGVGRELLPFEFDTASRLGAVMHWLTSPNATSAAMTFVAGKRVARWAGEKLGWISPKSQSELAEENNARATMADQDVPMGAVSAGRSGRPASSAVDRVVDRVSVDYIRRRYASMAGSDRAAAVAERDRLLAALPEETRTAAVDDVRERVFGMHYPGASYKALRAAGDRNKTVLDRFDADVFGKRSDNDWLVEDLNAYQRGLNMHRYGGGF